MSNLSPPPNWNNVSNKIIVWCPSVVETLSTFFLNIIEIFKYFGLCFIFVRYSYIQDIPNLCKPLKECLSIYYTPFFSYFGLNIIIHSHNFDHRSAKLVVSVHTYYMAYSKACCECTKPSRNTFSIKRNLYVIP